MRVQGRGRFFIENPRGEVNLLPEKEGGEGPGGCLRGLWGGGGGARTSKIPKKLSDSTIFPHQI